MNIRISRILFPTDFSEPARQAQKYAMELADRFQSELHLIHIVPEVYMPLPDASTSWTMPVTNLQADVEIASKRLQNEVNRPWADSHQIVRHVEVGNPVNAIITYAKTHEIDLIVVGTHGHTGLSHLLLGSNAEKVVRLATCPVLTIHPKGHQFVIDDNPANT
ncbi:universal stress protein [Schlesneria paludicola]|uniref:universal stress protein n=1 Tax=Schlesneria paludicola TaxID=360056 RepID=UPI00029ACF67|nr:universal stress protein [Schlesneria paludicola]